MNTLVLRYGVPYVYAVITQQPNLPTMRPHVRILCCAPIVGAMLLACIISPFNLSAQSVDDLHLSSFASGISQSMPNIERAQQAVDKSTLVYIENKGQWDSRAHFLLRSGGLDMWITSHGVLYDLYRLDKSEAKSDESELLGESPASETGSVAKRGHVVGISFEGVGSAPSVHAIGRQPGYYNYFIGNDQSKWTPNVGLYSGARIDNIYSGIDALFYLDEGRPRYDLLVRPGGDPKQIRMKIEGAENVSVLPSGALAIATTVGVVEQRELYAYQEMDGIRKKIACRFVVDAKRRVRFDVGRYDRTRPLVIDPLIYSPLLIGGRDQGQSIAIDGGGNAYITGSTDSPDYPVTTGAYDASYNDSTDAFVAKLDPTGSTLLYSTFIGGSGKDENLGNSIVVDAGGNAYIAGGTESADYPTTSGAYDMSFNGGITDAFVTKLNASGNALVYSTYIGGATNDRAAGIAIDGSGNACIIGSTLTPLIGFVGYPTTAGAYDTASNGLSDLFVTKLNAAGSGLLYSTFIGGRRDDRGDGIAIDASGNAYVSGYSSSTTIVSDYPTTAGAYDSSPGGALDIVLSKLSPDGSTLLYSTFLGGSQTDYGSGLAVDGSGNVFIAGSTEGGGFPSTVGVYKRIHGGGTQAYVAKLNHTGSALLYSTFLGSGSCFDVAIDGNGNAYAAGSTTSSKYPTTAGAYDTSHNGSNDLFVTKLNSTGSALLYSTFIGGSSFEETPAIALDGSGNIFVTGNTGSSDFPVSPGAYDVALGGSTDAYVTKLNATGSALIYSTFVGGDGDDPSSSIELRDDSDIGGSSSLHLSIPVPNPASDEIRASYSLAEPGIVRLEVYGADGRRVAVAIDGAYRSSGSHIETVDVSKLTSGTYLLRLIAGEAISGQPFSVVR